MSLGTDPFQAWVGFVPGRTVTAHPGLQLPLLPTSLEISACLLNMPKKRDCPVPLPLRDPISLTTSCGGHSCSCTSHARCQARPRTAGTKHTQQHPPVSRRMVCSQDSSPRTPALRSGPPRAGALCQHLGRKPTSPAPRSTFLHSQGLEKASADQSSIYSPKGTP